MTDVTMLETQCDSCESGEEGHAGHWRPSGRPAQAWPTHPPTTHPTLPIKHLTQTTRDSIMEHLFGVVSSR